MQVRGTGYEPGKTVRVQLIDKKKHAPLRTPDGSPAEKLVTLPDDQPVEQEIIFKPEGLGPLQVEAVAELQQGELDHNDNTKRRRPGGPGRQDQRPVRGRLPALGVPLHQERDDPRQDGEHLLPADQRQTTGFAQEGDRPDPDFGPDDPRTGEKFPGPISRFPDTMEELMKYDVVLFGDVEPRLFDDTQLQLISDFVDKNGGGFGMVAGPRFSPVEYRNTPIEAVLPVNIAHVLPDDPTAEYREGFRPVVTDEGRRGEASTIFRFFPDKAVNDKYLREDLQPVFWYCRGVSVKPGVGLVYAEHPFDSDPNTGRKAPILVLGRFGAGRTLFSAIDDSWRWRYYTGESVFDTYWVQQLRYLARSKKLGQRKVRFAGNRNTYELGDPVTLELNVLDPSCSRNSRRSCASKWWTRPRARRSGRRRCSKQEASPDIYTVTFTADRVGKFRIKPPGQPAALAEAMRETQAVEVDGDHPAAGAERAAGGPPDALPPRPAASRSSRWPRRG